MFFLYLPVCYVYRSNIDRNMALTSVIKVFLMVTALVVIKGAVLEEQKSNSASSGESGACAAKLLEMQAMVMMPGMELPRCDAEGNYLGMQFTGSMAFCVTSRGVMIEEYSVPRWETGYMDCKCAREEYDNKQTGMLGKFFSCERNGNYAPKGCRGSKCYCQDRNGQQVGTQLVDIGRACLLGDC